jgi:hypothetical protein
MIKSLTLLANALDEKGFFKEADGIDEILSNLKDRHLRSHIVASGEVLGVIANNYNVTVDEILELNKLESPDKISIGQELIIPDETGFSNKNPEPLVEYDVTDDEIVAATLMGEGGSMYDLNIMKRVYTVILNRSEHSGKSPKEVVLSPRQFSYWNDGITADHVSEKVNEWKFGTLPATQERWKEAMAIVESGLTSSEVGASAYYLNTQLAGKGFIGPNWKLIYEGDAGDPHSYGLNGPPWDDHKA